MTTTINASTSSGLINTADTSGILQLQTANTAALTIDASQNVGIGTSSPSYKLDVRASGYPAINIESTSGSGANGAYFQAKNGGGASSNFGTETTSGSYSYTGAIANSAYIGSLGANPLQLITNSVARATLNSSGNLGLGITPSAWGSDYKAIQFASGAISSYQTSAIDLYGNAYDSSAGTWKYQNSSLGATRLALTNGQFQFYNAPVGTAGNAITFTQAMTLDASGNLMVGKTASAATSVGFQVGQLGEVYTTKSTSTNADATYYLYSTGAGAYRFYVGLGGTISATSTTITGISDQRLKENIRDLDDGLEKVMALQPRKFDWKEGKGADIKNARGFIAQEFETVFPDMVEEWLDPAPEGEEPYKAVNANLIPTLVKAIQEQQALITQLQADVAALKGA